MKTLFLVSLSLMLAVLCSCSSPSYEEKESVSINAMALDLAAPPPEAEVAQSAGTTANTAINKMMYSPATTGNTSLQPTKEVSSDKKKIIKDGNISVKTQNIATAKKNIDETLKKLNAYYETEDLQNNDYRINYDLKVRVPSENFEQLIAFLENGKDEITAKNIHARDVTEEYTDIEIRLANKRGYLKRYQELLSKAKNVEEILQIEENIRVLEEEIESSEGRLKYLNDQVSFSTLSIFLFRDKPYIYKAPEEDSFGERAKRSVSGGWKGTVKFVLWLITIWPFIVAGLITWYFVKRLIKRRRNRKKE